MGAVVPSKKLQAEARIAVCSIETFTRDSQKCSRTALDLLQSDRLRAQLTVV